MAVLLLASLHPARRNSAPLPDPRAQALHLLHRSDARRGHSGGDGRGAGADEERGDGERPERHRHVAAALASPEPNQRAGDLGRTRSKPPGPCLALLPAASTQLIHHRRRRRRR